MTDIDLLPSDLPYRLPAEAYAYLLRDLARALPPPPDPSEETKTLRKQSLIAQISALCPNDAIEAGLAADHIIATEQSANPTAGSRSTAPTVSTGSRARPRLTASP